MDIVQVIIIFSTAEDACRIVKVLRIAKITAAMDALTTLTEDINIIITIINFIQMDTTVVFCRSKKLKGS